MLSFIFVLILGILLFYIFERKRRLDWDWQEILIVSFGVGASLLTLTWLLISRFVV